MNTEWASLSTRADSSSPSEIRRVSGRIWPQRLTLTILAAGVVLAVDTLTPWGLAIWLLQVVLVWTATLWAERRQMLTIAAVCSTFILAAFSLSPRTGPITWVDWANLLLCLGTVIALTHSCLRRIAMEDARRKTAVELGQMFRIVSGLLPVCAWCKKIRNEAGKWETWDVYSRNHSALPITHGMCEDCVARFTPTAEEDPQQP